MKKALLFMLLMPFTLSAQVFCDSNVFHFGNSAETASEIIFTYENSGPDQMYVEAESANPSDTLDVFIFAPGPGATAPAQTPSNPSPGVYRIDLDWSNAGGMPTMVPAQIVWSKQSAPGNWQLDPVGTGFSYPSNSSCGASSSLDSADITFSVDMSQYSGSASLANGVFLNGTFNNWCGSCNPMTDMGNGIWEVTLRLDTNVTSPGFEYKFTVDGWVDQENFVGGEPCTVTNGGFTNRFFSTSTNVTIPTVCFNSCSACSSNPTPVYDVTFQVDMNNVTQSFTTPEINGNFPGSGWAGGTHYMMDPDGNGIWEITIPMDSGATYEYKFAADAWTIQEDLTPIAGSPCVLTTSGFTNRVITISSDTIVNAVCWESCSACTGALPEYHVNFKVDMSQYLQGGGTFTTPEVNGAFTGWVGGTHPMKDADGDSIYERTIAIHADSIEYKFAADNWAIQETFAGGESCTRTTNGFTNRYQTISGDVDLPVVCWESCLDCSGSTPPAMADVTFKVDLSEYSGTWTVVNLNGTFNGWCGGCAVMTDADNDSIYELTVSVPMDTIEYKFTLDGWTVDEQFTPGMSCTKTSGGFTNRVLVPAGDTTLPAVCWESCDVCASSAPMVDITFQVDLSQYTGSYTEVNLNGTFNGWCGSCAVMTDADNDSIYEITVSLPAGDTIDYKFTLDGWTTEEQFAGGEACTRTLGGFTNRTYVPMADETLAAVCWNSCDACVTSSIGEELWQSPIVISPNPAKDVLRIAGELKMAGEVTFVLYDVQGREILTRNYTGTQLNDEWNVSGLSDGMYTIRIQTEGSVTTEKVIIRK